MFRFFASCKDFLLPAAESAGYTRIGYPARTTVFLASLATLRETGFCSDRPELAKTGEKLARQDARPQRNPIRSCLLFARNASFLVAAPPRYVFIGG
jgi:hypothetical protein